MMLRISFQSGLEPHLKQRYLPIFATLRGGGYFRFAIVYHIGTNVSTVNFTNVSNVEIIYSQTCKYPLFTFLIVFYIIMFAAEQSVSISGYKHISGDHHGDRAQISDKKTARGSGQV